MKKNSHPIDDFFREALEDHQVTPSPEARSAFLREASRGGSPSRRGWLWWVIPGSVVLLTAVSLVFLYSPEERIESSAPVRTSTSSPAPAPRPIPAGAKTPEGAVIHNSRLKINNKNQNNTYVQNISFTTTPDPSAGRTSAGIPVSAISSMTAETQPGAQAELPSPPVPAAADIPAPPAPVAIESLPIIDSVVTDSIPPPTVTSPKPKAEGPGPSRPWSLNLGVNYTAEWMFNTLEGRKYVNNFGLEVSFRFDRYSVRTGAGLSITEGTNEWLVEYNDYLGVYSKLDSMDFSWDENHYHLLPSYYMSQKDVWDSLVKMDYPTIVKRYTYLQIPLVLGYDVIRKGRFSAGLRAGPILSVLLSSKQLSDSYDPGKNNVILINQISPDRIQVNWQVMGGLNTSLMMTRSLSIEIEPQVRYYFNSVYEPSDITKKPWSVGVRAAFLIKL